MPWDDRSDDKSCPETEGTKNSISQEGGWSISCDDGGAVAQRDTDDESNQPIRQRISQDQRPEVIGHHPEIVSEVGVDENPLLHSESPFRKVNESNRLLSGIQTNTLVAIEQQRHFEN
jgi:hypothetical protein